LTSSAPITVTPFGGKIVAGEVWVEIASSGPMSPLTNASEAAPRRPPP
jgi:hypothetical protein